MERKEVLEYSSKQANRIAMIAFGAGLTLGTIIGKLGDDLLTKGSGGKEAAEIVTIGKKAHNWYSDEHTRDRFEALTEDDIEKLALNLARADEEVWDGAKQAHGVSGKVLERALEISRQDNEARRRELDGKTVEGISDSWQSREDARRAAPETDAARTVKS